MAKVTYIQGHSEPQHFSDGKETAPISTFWHRKAPGKNKTVCGMTLARGVSTATKRPEQRGRGMLVCKNCDRITAGRDPVFDSRGEQAGARKPEDIGTRAKPTPYARGGTVIA